MLQSASFSPKKALYTFDVPVFMDSFQGVTLDWLALVASKARVSGSPVTVRDGETVSDQVPSPGNSQTADWNTLPLFLWKKPIQLSWNCSLKARLLVWHNLGTWRAAPRGWRPVDTIFVLSFFLTPGYWYLLERSVSTNLAPWILRVPPRGHPRITWLSYPVGLMLPIPQDHIHLHTLEAAAWGSGFQWA